MGHIAYGEICPAEAAPLLIGNARDVAAKLKPIKGEPMTFTAAGLVDGKDADALRLIPFFRLHDSRYMVYWPQSTPDKVQVTRQALARAEAAGLALARLTVDQVAPGEQQPESDHAFEGEGSDSGVKDGRH